MFFFGLQEDNRKKICAACGFLYRSETFAQGAQLL